MGQPVRTRTSFEAMAQHPMTNNTLKTADPTIVENPTSVRATNKPMSDVANSGAEPPAAFFYEK
jgi:hypothetical protein